MERYKLGSGVHSVPYRILEGLLHRVLHYRGGFSTKEGDSPLWMECLRVFVVVLATVLQTEVLGIASLYPVCYCHLELQCCGQHFCTQSATLGCGASELGALIHEVGARLCHQDSILFPSSQSPMSFAHDNFQPGRIFAPRWTFGDV